MELSLPGVKMRRNFRSRERKLHGTFVPRSENVVELSLSMKHRTASAQLNNLQQHCIRCDVYTQKSHEERARGALF